MKSRGVLIGLVLGFAGVIFFGCNSLPASDQSAPALRATADAIQAQAQQLAQQASAIEVKATQEAQAAANALLLKQTQIAQQVQAQAVQADSELGRLTIEMMQASLTATLTANVITLRNNQLQIEAAQQALSYTTAMSNTQAEQAAHQMSQDIANSWADVIFWWIIRGAIVLVVITLVLVGIELMRRRTAVVERAGGVYLITSSPLSARIQLDPVLMPQLPEQEKTSEVIEPRPTVVMDRGRYAGQFYTELDAAQAAAAVETLRRQSLEFMELVLQWSKTTGEMTRIPRWDKLDEIAKLSGKSYGANKWKFVTGVLASAGGLLKKPNSTEVGVGFNNVYELYRAIVDRKLVFHPTPLPDEVDQAGVLPGNGTEQHSGEQPEHPRTLDTAALSSAMSKLSKSGGPR